MGSQSCPTAVPCLYCSIGFFPWFIDSLIMYRALMCDPTHHGQFSFVVLDWTGQMRLLPICSVCLWGEHLTWPFPNWPFAQLSGSISELLNWTNLADLSLKARILPPCAAETGTGDYSITAASCIGLCSLDAHMLLGRLNNVHPDTSSVEASI